jgi:hypothetical protein
MLAERGWVPLHALIQSDPILQVDKKDPDATSQGSEKKDPEKKEENRNEFCKTLERAKDECVLQFNQVTKKYFLQLRLHLQYTGGPRYSR